MSDGNVRKIITKTFSEGYYCEGESINGRIDGQAKFYSPQGSLIYEGAFKEDKFWGFGRSYRQDGTLLYEGDFKDNKYDGAGKIYRPIGKLYYEGGFKNNKYSGYGRIYDINGSLKFEGIFADDLQTDDGLQHIEIEGTTYKVFENNDSQQSPGKSPNGKASKDRTVYGMLTHHCGYVVEFPDATLMFDCIGNWPNIRKDVPLYIFISHIHSDHFNRSVFDFYHRSVHTEIFLGFDHENDDIENMLNSLPEEIQNNLSCFDGVERLYSDDGKLLVRSFESTDLGVAFLVEINGKKIFHSGDLADWTKGRDYFEKLMRQFHPKMSQHEITSLYLQQSIELPAEFADRAGPLKNEKIDYAMITLNTTSVESSYRTVETFHSLADIKYWTPMHLFKDYSFIDTYLSAHSEHKKNMIGVTKEKDIRQRISEMRYFPLFTI